MKRVTYKIEILILFLAIFVMANKALQVMVNINALTVNLNALTLKHQSLDLDNAPTPGNEDILRAILIYKIKIPANTSIPYYNPGLPHRGETTIGNIFMTSQVAIGQSAFISWGLLGSTIAHEVEVHCNQNLYGMMWGYLVLGYKDVFKYAEIEAYNHELLNKDRFNINNEEISDIEYSRNMFF